MGKPQGLFGTEFEAEAVRLVETRGRTQREMAKDLGIGLSTLRRWLDKRRDGIWKHLLPSVTRTWRPNRSDCDAKTRI